MTLDELNQHLELVRTLKHAKRILQSLRDATYPCAAKITGMPHTPGVNDKVGDLAVDIADIEVEISELEAAIKDSENSIFPWIRTIDNVQTRFIFRLRFVRGLTWKEVASIIGGHNSEESVKMACYRYLGCDD